MDREEIINRLKKIAFNIFPTPSHPVIFIVIEYDGKYIYMDWIRTPNENTSKREDRIYWKLDDWQHVPVGKIADAIIEKWGIADGNS